MDYLGVALQCLRQDRRRSIHDKVAGNFDYEELIGTLLAAKARISELETDRDTVQAEVGLKLRENSNLGGIQC